MVFAPVWMLFVCVRTVFISVPVYSWYADMVFWCAGVYFIPVRLIFAPVLLIFTPVRFISACVSMVFMPVWILHIFVQLICSIVKMQMVGMPCSMEWVGIVCKKKRGCSGNGGTASLLLSVITTYFLYWPTNPFTSSVILLMLSSLSTPFLNSARISGCLFSISSRKWSSNSLTLFTGTSRMRPCVPR